MYIRSVFDSSGGACREYFDAIAIELANCNTEFYHLTILHTYNKNNRRIPVAIVFCCNVLNYCISRPLGQP